MTIMPKVAVAKIKIMKRLIYWIIPLIVFSSGSFFLQAESLITVDELKDKLSDENVQLISCQKEIDYKASHIKGALNLWHAEMCKEPADMGILMDAQDLANYLGNNGIDLSKQIVLYDDGSNKYASRVFWALNYLGAKDICILNGHFDAWFAKGYPVTRNPTPFKAVQNTIQLNEDIYASMADIKALSNNSNTLIIDVRSKDEFTSIGHIPGAMLFYWESVLNLNKTFKSGDLITEIAISDGLDPSKQIILYCATAVKASVVYFAMKEIAHFPNVKIYDGAFKEWTSYSTNTVIK